MLLYVLGSYRNTWMWSDGTAAHFISLSAFMSLLSITEVCATLPLYWIQSFTGTKQLIAENCAEIFDISFRLCEIPVASSQQFEPPQLSTAAPSVWFTSVKSSSLSLRTIILDTVLLFTLFCLVLFCLLAAGSVIL